ncbi:MAG: hypothetical protein RBT49_06405 [Bacteroidales bacterium]|jgi:hypothetical protein|nr:hypothetical protein [Bacteroidales bacterium]
MKKSLKNEPSINTECYNVSIVEALSWYRDQNIKSEILKSWLVEAGKKLDVSESYKISDLSDSWLVDTWAYVAKLYLNDCNLKEADIYNLVNKIKYYVRKVEQEKDKPKAIAPVEKVKEAATEIVESLSDYLDNESFNIKDYIVKNVFGVSYVRQILKNLDKDKHQKHINDIEQWLEENKPKRKQRKKKIKSEEDICKLFKCCMEHEGLKGVNPIEILGKECVIVYHTQKKHITFYFGKKLSVHRSMIIGFDEKKSKQFDVKKQTLKELNNVGKITIDKIYNECYSNTKEFEIPTGRVTDKMIILGKY